MNESKLQGDVEFTVREADGTIVSQTVERNLTFNRIWWGRIITVTRGSAYLRLVLSELSTMPGYTPDSRKPYLPDNFQKRDENGVVHTLSHTESFTDGYRVKLLANFQPPSTPRTLKAIAIEEISSTGFWANNLLSVLKLSTPLSIGVTQFLDITYYISVVPVVN